MEINNKIKKGWIKSRFAIEVMAKTKEVAEEALSNHVEKLENAKDTKVLNKEFEETQEVENPPKNQDQAFSQICEIEVLNKNLYVLLNIIMLFGPSSIEILEPQEINMKIDELQNIANQVAGLMHQYASAGLGGMVISPDKK